MGQVVFYSGCDFAKDYFAWRRHGIFRPGAVRRSNARQRVSLPSGAAGLFL